MGPRGCFGHSVFLVSWWKLEFASALIVALFFLNSGWPFLRLGAEVQALGGLVWLTAQVVCPWYLGPMPR